MEIEEEKIVQLEKRASSSSTYALPISTNSVTRIRRTSDKRIVIAGLMPNESLSFVGSVQVKLLCGSVDIFGYNLPANSPLLTITSPVWTAALSIICKENYSLEQEEIEMNINDVINSEKEEAELTSLIFEMGEMAPTVLIFKPLEDLYQKEDHFNIIDDNLWQYEEGGDLPGFHVIVKEDADVVKKNPAVLGVSVPYRGLNIPSRWGEIINIINNKSEEMESPCILTCGAKGVGKSTLSRYLINNLLSTHNVVAYLDCDIGQPEFTCPGLVSLLLVSNPIFGPPHTHLQTPSRAYFIGDVSSKSEPRMYLEAIKKLYDEYRSEIACLNVPLVINTQGWVKGMGYELLNAVIRDTSPHHIISIQGSSKAKSFDIITPNAHTLIHTIIAWNEELSPRDSLQSKTLRNLRLSNYFCPSSELKGKTNSVFLASAIPYSVDWNNVGLRVLHENIDEVDILQVLNASIVALCVSPHLPNTINNIEGMPRVFSFNPLIPCVGFGNCSLMLDLSKE